MRKVFNNVSSQKRRTIWYLIVTALILVCLSIPAYVWMHSSNKRSAEIHNSRMSPVIMVPGSSATKERFNTLVKLLNQDTDRKHSLLKLEVKNNGKITYSGKINKGDHEPIIVVGFENNHDGYSNIKKQAKMFNKAFEELSEQYKFNNFKAFGHSNGGLIWTLWLEKYYSQYSSDISIKRLMTVGTPYNFDETSTSQRTQMFNDFVQNRKKIPHDITMISVIGTEDYDSDGLVPANSVEAGKYIYQKQVKHFLTLTVSGANAQHSDLPQNKEIIRVIEQYLLDSNRPNKNKNKKNNNQQ